MERTLGGAATYFSVAASFFTHVNLVAVVGDDFIKDEAIFQGRAPSISRAWNAPKGRCFFWAGRYSQNLNERVTLVTELNVFADVQAALAGEVPQVQSTFSSRTSRPICSATCSTR